MWLCRRFKATDSKIHAMSTYLWEYAQVTKDDLSPHTATLLPVRSSNIFCRRVVNDVLEYGAPLEF